MNVEFFLMSDVNTVIKRVFTTDSYKIGELVILDNIMYVIKKVVHDLDNNKKLVVIEK